MSTANGMAPASRPRARGHLGRAEIAISARGIATRAAAGEQSVGVRDVSLDVVRGEITVIAGTPDSGKTELLRLLGGLDRPQAGTVWIGDRRIEAGPGRPEWRFRRDELVFIGSGRAARSAMGASEILSTLAPEPQHAFLDEPARGASAGGLERVHAALYALTAIVGHTVVVATDRAEIAAWADRLLVMNRGAVVRDLDSPTQEEAAGALGLT